MHASHKAAVLRGQVVGFNLSPKGVPEGILLDLAGDGGIVQVNFDPEVAVQVTGCVVTEGQVLIVDAADAHAEAAR